MLVLTGRPGDIVYVLTESGVIAIEHLKVSRQGSRLGFNLPPDVKVIRGQLAIGELIEAAGKNITTEEFEEMAKKMVAARKESDRIRNNKVTVPHGTPVAKQ